MSRYTIDDLRLHDLSHTNTTHAMKLTRIEIGKIKLMSIKREKNTHFNRIWNIRSTNDQQPIDIGIF